MKTTWAVAVVLTTSLSWAVESQKSEKIKDRLEKLFVWRVSDRLGLTPEQEEKFNKKYSDLSSERRVLTGQLTDAMNEMERVKAKSADSDKALKKYREILNKLSTLQQKELDELGKDFGPQKMVEYILLKREMTEKFKDVLTQAPQASGSTKTLKEPEVIQEN